MRPVERRISGAKWVGMIASEGALRSDRARQTSLEDELRMERDRVVKFQGLLEVEQKNVTKIATKMVGLQAENVQIQMEKITLEEIVHEHKASLFLPYLDTSSHC